MAANEYYSGLGSNHNDGVPPPPPESSKPYPYSRYSDPYGRRNSQYTLEGADYDYHNPSSATGGRLQDTDNQYADDIPLKSHAQHQTGDRPAWSNVDTHYQPSPDDQQAVPLNGQMGTPQRRRSKKKGFFKKKIPWFTYLISVVHVAVFIAELVKNAQLTGSPIMIKPEFNPMIGPSPYVQINMGARYVACMHNVDGVQNANDTIGWPCPWAKTDDLEDADRKCTLSELCGFGGVPNPEPHGSLDQKPEPHQWFRFIVPMFLHAGLIHIGFNLMGQLTLGADMERTIGWWRFAIVYFASGIFGFVLGGNFAAPGIASTGASGCLFGILALTVLDLFYTWKSRRSPMVELIIIIVTIAISFVLGLLPGLDNFSHIGGFLTGLVLGISILRSPDPLRERIGTTPSYVSMSGGLAPAGGDEAKKFIKGPVGFFKGRKPLWWGWWILRIGALVGIIVALILLLQNFYVYRTTCGWCKYLTCLPVKDWCDIGNIIQNENENKRRALISSADSIFKGQMFL
ncbi:hypothetical protein AJ80_07640 [Polytolypa hystricis UAMH7299]|uniref:Rhomboid-type serine protease n=1 Tax=Polytolypa hystricis (strain UAMH7299) TaxID=1447883 RepID=A0A2B7XL68_POLH7|nr:hypothetical protein AJ80_07640 [Polytolypa hystricis UAMH7299]